MNHSPKLACGSCGLRYREGRPGDLCARAGCKGRLGFPVHVSETIDRTIRIARARASSFEAQARSSERTAPHRAAFQRGAAAACSLMADETERILSGDDAIEGPIRALVWPEEPATDAELAHARMLRTLCVSCGVPIAADRLALERFVETPAVTCGCRACLGALIEREALEP